MIITLLNHFIYLTNALVQYLNQNKKNWETYECVAGNFF